MPFLELSSTFIVFCSSMCSNVHCSTFANFTSLTRLISRLQVALTVSTDDIHITDCMLFHLFSEGKGAQKMMKSRKRGLTLFYNEMSDEVLTQRFESRVGVIRIEMF